MPSHSPEQARLMRAVAHGWRPDRIQGPPVSVAKEFVAADKRKHMAHGGQVIAGGSGVRIGSEGSSPGEDADAGGVMAEIHQQTKDTHEDSEEEKNRPKPARTKGEEIPQFASGGVVGRTVVDMGDHFHVTDSRGPFRVAKRGLDEPTHAKIRAMCSGGEVQGYYDGGGVKKPSGMVDMAHPENLSPEMQQALLTAQLQAQNPTPDMQAAGVATHEASPNDIVPGTNLTYAQVVDANAESSTGAPPPRLKPTDPQATLGPGALNRLQGAPRTPPKPLTTLQPKGGISAPAPAGGGGGGIPGMDPAELRRAEAANTQAGQQEQAAITQQGAAEHAQAQQQAELLKQKATGEADLMAQQQRMAADHQQALAAQTTAYQKAVDEFSRAQVDPNRYWANASTGQKVLAGIGLLFGAFGAARDGVNKSVAVINQAIDRDIDAQKENIAVKGRGAEMQRGILGAMRERFQDEAQALQAAGDAYRQHAATLMEEMAARTQDPIRQAQLKATAAGLLQSRAQERLAMVTGFQAKAAEIAVARQKLALGWAKLGLAQKPAPVVDTSALDRLEQANLKGNITEYGSALDSAAISLATQLNGGKAPRPATVQMIRDMLPNRLSSADRVRKTIDNLKQTLRFASPGKGVVGGADISEDEE